MFESRGRLPLRDEAEPRAAVRQLDHAEGNGIPHAQVLVLRPVDAGHDLERDAVELDHRHDERHVLLHAEGRAGHDGGERVEGPVLREVDPFHRVAVTLRADDARLPQEGAAPFALRRREAALLQVLEERVDPRLLGRLDRIEVEREPPIRLLHQPPLRRTMTAWLFAFPLRLWQRPHSPPTYRSFGTCALNWRVTSTACAPPVAPRGWPHPRRPPRRFVGSSPPIRDCPSIANLPPSPFGQRPRSSYSMISLIVKQSWVSARSMSWTVTPAILNASAAARFNGSHVVRDSRFTTREPDSAWPRPSTNTGVSVYRLAASPCVSRAAAAPSVIPLQSRSFSGGAIFGLPRTFSRVTRFGKCAVGFVAA